MASERRQRLLTPYLETAPNFIFVFYAIFAAFWTYFCMYAFRRPFTVAQFEGQGFFGSEVTLKTALLISQIIGYTLSKYIGIKVCSEIRPGARAFALVMLVLGAQASLILFGLLPGDLKIFAIFLNGLPLGMVWGMVVWYLEGRRTSELLLAGLSCSFILASGAVKDVGNLVLGWGVSESWMPAVTGFLFLGPFLTCVWMLNQLPQPTEADVKERVEREPMNAARRWAFIRHFLPGLAMLFLVYFFLTAYRDFRDSFGQEMFIALGYEDRPAKFTRTELPVAFGVMFSLAALNLIKDNRWGLVGAFGIMASGLAIMGVGTLLWDQDRIDGATWMVLNGLGAYLAYVPYGSVLFDRLIASTRVVGTAVFAIYVADALGYTGSVCIYLYKDLGLGETPRLEFFVWFSYLMSVGGTVLFAASCAYFIFGHQHHGRERTAAAVEAESP